MRRRATLLRAALLATAASLALPGVASADPGDLDQSFGDDGIVNVPLGAFDIALAPGNGLWVGGTGTDGEGDPAAGITRLRQNGQHQLTFGDAGELVWTFPRGGRFPSTSVSDVAALPGGGVQISGEWCRNRGDCLGEKARSFVARFDASGAPDLGFGEEGVIAAQGGAFSLTSLGGDASVHACELNNLNRNRVVVRRYLPDGQRDLAFSDDGRKLVHLPGPSDYRTLKACGASADGGTLVATMDGSSFSNALRVKKLTRAGLLDVSYGDGGMTTVSRDEIYVESAVVSADGTAWFAGVQWPPGGATVPLVLGLTAEGERDTTFGGEDGIGVLDLPQLTGAMQAHPAVRSDGSVAVTGTLPGGPVDRYPYLAMLTPDGDVDMSFGDGGMASGYADLLPPVDLVIDDGDRVVTANHPVGSGSGSVVIRFQA